MQTLKKYRVLKILTFLIFASGIFSACGGADVPYSISQPKGPDVPPPVIIVDPPTGSRCAIKLQSTKMKIHGFGGPGSPGHDAGQPDGEFSSNDSDLPDIPIRFYGTDVKLIPADFPLNATFSLGLPIGIKLVDGSNPSGTFTPSDNNIEINNVQFEISSDQIGRITLPAMKLTTKDITIDGRFGDVSFRSDHGTPLNPGDKSVKFVGGFTISDTFGQGSPFEADLRKLRGGAMLVSLSGTLERTPDGSPCSDGGAGVVATEVVGSGSSASEAPLGDGNTFFVGSVFQAEQGVDTPSDSDTRFTKTKTLRVKNATTTAVSGSMDNRQGFVITPAGAFNIAPNEAKDFTVKFNVPAATVPADMPASRDVTSSYSFGPLAVNFKASVKKPGPELVVTGTEENARSTIDFKNVPAKVSGTGASSRLQCNAQTVPSYLSHKVTIQNNGIRDLRITKINRPVDAATQNPDPGCIAGYGSEFVRMALTPDMGVTCEQYVANGRSYNTDNCTILKDSNKKITFKVVYLPVNASSIVNAQNGTPQQDAATLDIENNDLTYVTTHGKYTLNLTAAVSADKSDAMSMSRAIGTNPASLTDSGKAIRQGGLTRINISNTTELSVSQYFYLKNISTDVLTISNIALVGDNATNFEILARPATVPAATPTEDGKAVLGIRFTKQSLTRASVKLNITFRSGTVAGDNIFSINLDGTVNRTPIDGRMQIRAVAYNVLVDNNTAGIVNSEDYRNHNQNILPGPITVNFQSFPATPGSATPDPSIKKVLVEPALATQGILPTNENLLQSMVALNPADRSKLFRFYSTRGTTGGGEGSDHHSSTDPLSIACNEPASIARTPQQYDCSYFYYVFAQKADKTGFYDDDSGEIILPDLDLKMLIPYHYTIGRYNSDQLSVMELHGSMTTLTVDSSSINNFPGSAEALMLVPNGVNLELPANTPQTTQPLGSTLDTQCPDNWEPKNFETTPALPKIGCFMTHSTRPFLRGFSFQEQADGTYIGTLVMLVEFGGDNAMYGNPPKPQNIPFFFTNSRMFMTFTAVLEPVPAAPAH